MDWALYAKCLWTKSPFDGLTINRDTRSQCRPNLARYLGDRVSLSESVVIPTDIHESAGKLVK